MKIRLFTCVFLFWSVLTSLASDQSLREISETLAKSGVVSYVRAGYNSGKPGFYEYRQGLSLIAFLAKTGGISLFARGDYISVRRNEKQFRLKVTEVLEGESKDLLLEPGDVVDIPIQGCFGGGLSDEELAAVNRKIGEYASRIK